MMYKVINIFCDVILNSNRLKYTIDFLNCHPLKPQNLVLELNGETGESLNINYSPEKPAHFYIPVQNLFFGNASIDLNEIFINKYEYNGEAVFSVEKKKSENIMFINGNEFSFDIFETIFFHISRFEEVFSESYERDEHSRIKTQDQILVRNNLHLHPVVDRLVLAFYRALDFNIPDTVSNFSMTHDVDAIHKFNSAFKLPKSIIRILLMGLGFRGIFDIMKWYFKSILNKDQDPYYVFDSILVPDNIFSNKIIFFVAGGNSGFDLFNENYYKWLPVVIGKAIKNDYYIGFHPSYLAYNDPEMFRSELELLKRSARLEINHVRTHFLRMDFNSTFNISEDNGITLDSTLGFPDNYGFRCGTGFSYFLYDFQDERQSAIRELPLIIMDSALLYIYCKDSEACFRDSLFDFIEKNRYNTHITFNFHNSTFDRSMKTRSGILKIYSELITDIRNYNLKINP